MFTLCRLICLAYVLGSIDFLNLNTPRIDSIDHDENPLKPKPKSSSYVNAKVKQTQSRLRHQHYFQKKEIKKEIKKEKKIREKGYLHRAEGLIP